MFCLMLFLYLLFHHRISFPGIAHRTAIDIVQEQPPPYDEVLFKNDRKRERKETVRTLHAHTYSPVPLCLCRRAFRRMGHSGIYHVLCRSVLVQTCRQMADQTSRGTEDILSDSSTRIGNLCGSTSAHRGSHACLSSSGSHVLSLPERTVEMGG